MSDSAACCSCCEPLSEQADAIGSYTGEMAPELESLRNVGFGLLYKTRNPVTLATLAEQTGVPIEDAGNRLSEIEAAGRARRDSEGNLVGIAGLSLEPTSHSVTIEGRDFWTWCALDAVGIFTALGATGHVKSSPPGDFQDVEIHFIEGATDSATALFIAGGYDGTDVFEAWCPNVNFFATPEDANAWAADRGVDGDVVSIPEVSEIAGSIWASVVNGST